MASIAALRKQAKDAGASRNEIIAATTPDELRELIDQHSGKKSAPRKKAVAKKKSTGRKQVRKSTTRKTTISKKSSGRKSAPARSRKSGTAKRQTTARSNGYVAKGGRNMIEDVDFSVTDGWNPRPGSPPDLIVKSLKKHKGNRSKVHAALAPKVFDFVGKKMADGTKRNKESALKMLAYRISRTAFDFAIRTGQHEASTNRVQYGTGDTGQGLFKPKKRTGKSQATRMVSSRKKATQGRRKGTAKKATRRKAANRR